MNGLRHFHHRQSKGEERIGKKNIEVVVEDRRGEV
jgi:hypothetical protein